MTEPEQTAGSPTQQAPEELLKEIDALALAAREQFAMIGKQVRETLEAHEDIACRIERAVRRMEILRQTMRPTPAVTIQRKSDELLCAGEIAVLAAIKEEGGETDMDALQRRTGYAPGTLRTYLPMLRRKGLIAPDKLALTNSTHG